MNNEKEKVVIDAGEGILGRIASYAAKQALLGKSVIIINCHNALITGRRRTSIREYGEIRRRGGASLKGPFFPKHSERLMKRTVRGMLNYQQARGLEAFKRILCYPNVPEEYKNSKKIIFKTDTKAKTMSLQDLSKEI